MNFITAVAYHFCPSLSAAFTQPGASTLADLCSSEVKEVNLLRRLVKVDAAGCMNAAGKLGQK